MLQPGSIIGAIVLALAAVEALAYGWMHPAPAGIDQPVLGYCPPLRGRNAGRELANSEKTGAALTDIAGGNPEGGKHISEPDAANRRAAETAELASSFTPLPAIVARSLPLLHCSTGTAARIDREDGAIIHLAFFEWDRAGSSSVLEAFKHLPDECLGSIGMTLVAHRPSRSYQVDGETLAFDHTVFRDPSGRIVHAFKGTWVSGASSLLGNGLRGGGQESRQLLWMAALKRFRPAYACVAQGSVTGIPNPDFAWRAFESAMLHDLKFLPR